MRVLVSDTCAISNLRNGQLLEFAFGLPYEFAVPDLLATEELTADDVAFLGANGVVVVELPAEGVRAAYAHQARQRKLSLVDCFALTLAQTNDWCLLTDDGLLRATATAHRVELHGTLWLVEEMARHQVCSTDLLCAGIDRMTQHRTARFPRAVVAEVRQRIERGEF